MSKFLKKIVSFVATFTTIVTTAGVGTLTFAGQAVAASAGDLIKASGPAVYYYAADQKRYVFPNEKTYFSWYKDFSSVKTISDAELAAIMIGGNVTIRPGTKLVKITTDPKVYAVTQGGVLHWVQTESVAVALWGANWAQKVVDVPDGFFVNYSVGSSIASATHPDGSLVSYSGSSDRFLVWGGQKRKLSDAGFAANGFNPADVMMTTIQYPAGADVTGLESFGQTVIAGAVVPQGGSVSVSLASDTPAGITVPKGAASIAVAKYNFTAGSSAATITGLRLHQVGVAPTSDITNVYIYDAAGNRLTSGRTINSQDRTISFNSLNVSVPAGQTVALVVYADWLTTASAGGQFSFEVADAAATVISGAGTVSGSFPVRGNVFTTGASAAGRLDVLVGTTPANPNIGAKEVEISNFKLTANTNDIEVRRITLLQAGSITNTDLSNLKLYQGSTLVASAAALMNDKIVLNFSPAYLLTNGTTKVFSLKADVAGRSSRTIRTYVEYSTDVYAVDKVFNAGAAVCINASGNCSTGSFDGSSGSYYIEVTTQGGQLTVSFNGPTTSNVSKGSNGTVLYRFGLASQENDLEIKKIVMKLGSVGGNTKYVVGSASTAYFRNLKIKNLATGQTVMGPLSLSGTSVTTSTLTFTDSWNLKAGTSMDLALVADLYSGSDDSSGEFAGNVYQARLDNGSSAIFGSTDVRIINTGEYLATTKIVPNSPINGNNMTVKASSLEVSLAGSPSTGTVVKKQANIPSVGFVLTAGAQNDVLVTSIKLTGAGDIQSGTYAAADLSDVVTSCALFDGANQIGQAQSPDTSAGTMTISNMNLTIKAGSSKTLIANCTADSTIAGASGDKFSLGIAAAADVTAQDSQANTITPTLAAAVVTNSGTASQSVTQTVLSAGTLTVAADSMRQSTILVAGGDVWHNFAQVKATAQYEGMTIDKVAVTSTGDAASFAKVAVAMNGAVLGEKVLPAGIDTSSTIDLVSSPIMVPKDSSVSFQIWGKLANIQSSSSVSGATTGAARSGSSVKLGIASGIVSDAWDSNYSGKLNVRAAGSASGDLVYFTDSDGIMSNAFVTRKTKPVVTSPALGTNTLTGGSDLDLLKLQVGADSMAPVALKKITYKITFTTSTNSTLTLSNLRLRKGNTDIATSALTIANDTGTNLASGTLSSGSSASGTAFVSVTFASEETITGSGNVYTLHGTIGGNVVQGDSIVTALKLNGGSTVVTGYLTTATTTNSSVMGPQLDTSASADGGTDAVGTFIWSDQSENPHSDQMPTGAATSSRDWTDDVYVEDLTGRGSLAR